MTNAEIIEDNIRQMIELRPELSELEAAKAVAEQHLASSLLWMGKFQKVEKFVTNEAREILHAFRMDAPHWESET